MNLLSSVALCQLKSTVYILQRDSPQFSALSVVSFVYTVGHYIAKLLEGRSKLIGLGKTEEKKVTVILQKVSFLSMVTSLGQGKTDAQPEIKGVQFTYAHTYPQTCHHSHAILLFKN